STACNDTRTACVYKIPEGYRGWVLIEYGNTNCPPLPKLNGKRIVRIGKDARLCTGSAPEFGRATDEYYYIGKSETKLPVTGLGEGGLIWGGAIGNTAVKGRVTESHERFFVGTEQEFYKANSPLKADFNF